jgi:GSH-dependent disulfide-bond oxidoreductase
MIELYTHGTANGRKASIMLEEVGLEYRTNVVDILDGAQFEPDYKHINPNSKIPAIVDPDGPGGKPHTVFESGAILIYLAEKSGNPLLPGDPVKRSNVLQWLMFQMANIGPMFGQYHHFFSHAGKKVPYAIARYRREVERLYVVMEDRLGTSAYLAGDDYSIADLASYTWIARFEAPEIDLSIGERTHLRRWFDTLSARPAVQKGMSIPV